MAVTNMTGFEIGAIALDWQGAGGSSFNGTAAYDTGTVRTGAKSIRCNPASGASGYWSVALIAGSGYAHFAVRFATFPTVQRRILGGVAAGVPEVRINTDQTLGFYVGNALVGTSTAALVVNTWHWIGIRSLTGTSVVFLQIDGVGQVTGTATISNNLVNLGFSGSEASAADAYFDDVVTDDAGFLASSKVDLSLPISDNTVTGVTDNNGVTTNIWQCVDNTPPAGVASANEAANPKVGMHFPASTTCDYWANLETYTTLGVASGDTIIAVQWVVRHGEDIATGSKAGFAGNMTNPTINNTTAFTFGNDAGAHGAEVGLWATTSGTMQTPTNTPAAFAAITLGTSPTLNAGRNSQSRVGCMDFMGMLVAWTPAAAANPPYASIYPSLLAQ